MYVQARCKLDLREECTSDDALQIVDLVKHTIVKCAETCPSTNKKDNGRLSKNKVSKMYDKNILIFEFIYLIFISYFRSKFSSTC